MIRILSKIKNKIREIRQQDTLNLVNNEIKIANDKNDPDNKIYIYVCGVPVAIVCDVIQDGENCVLIDQVGECVANVKKMYLNSLNGKKIL